MKYLKSFSQLFENEINFRKISDFNTYIQIKKYVEQQLQKQGIKTKCGLFVDNDGNWFPQEGSSRLVYFIGDNKVLKLAKNKKGIEQNKMESNLEIQKNYSDIIAHLYDYDPNGKWIIQEKLEYIDESIFWKLTRINFGQICSWIESEFIFGNDILGKKKFCIMLKNLIIDFDLDKQDIVNIKNWGEIGGKVKLLDFGLSNGVRKKLYSGD